MSKARTTDLAGIARIIIILILGFIVFFSVYSMINFNNSHVQHQTTDIKRIIEKALVQCYALEGCYPANVEYVQKYGVIFENQRYYYYYEWLGGNLMPIVEVIKK